MDKLINYLDHFRSNKKLFAIILIASFAVVYILNFYYPLLFDDWAYSFADGQRKVDGIVDIFHSQYAHYFAWGGRSVVHAIAQMLLMYPPVVHDVINSLALCLLLLLFYRISNYGNRLNVWIYMAIGLLMWFMQPGFSSVYFWITGSANYMWGMLIITLFLYPLYIYYRSGKSDRGQWWAVPLALIGGVLAGWTNENMSVAIVTFILGIAYLLIKESRTIPTWVIFGLLGVIIGAVFMIAAPGNAIRFASEAHDRGLDSAESMISMERMLKAIPYMFFLYFKRLLLIVAPYLLLLWAYRKQNLSRENGDQAKYVWNTSLLFFIAGNVAFFAMTASMLFPSRAYFGILSLFIIGFTILLSNYKFNNLKLRKGLCVVTMIVLLFFVYDFIFIKMQTYKQIKDTFAKREILILEGKEQGQTDFVFYDGLKHLSGRLSFTDCGEDPNYWINSLYAKYYDVNSVTVYQAEKNQTLEEK